MTRFRSSAIVRIFVVAYILAAGFFAVGHIHFAPSSVKIADARAPFGSEHECPACAFRASISSGITTIFDSASVELVWSHVVLNKTLPPIVGEVEDWLLPGTRAPPFSR